MPANITSQNIQIGTPFPAWRLPNGINKASDSDLERSASSCERWVIASGLLVVLGLIVEAVVAFIHPSYDSPVETWAPFIADTLVALGVAGEVLFSMMSSRRHNELLVRSNAKLADAIMQAGEATEKASVANARASIANHKAQEAILELVRFKAPRIFDPNKIAEKVKIFPGVKYSVAVTSTDPEYLTVITLIEAALGKAGWSEIDWMGPGQPRPGRPIIGVGVSCVNVMIGVSPQDSDSLFGAAQSLAMHLEQKALWRLRLWHLCRELVSI